jgi:hypothetical protein
MCLTSPATVTSVEERGGISIVSVEQADEGQRECITYIDGLKPGDRVLIAGGAIVERLPEHPEPKVSLAGLLIAAFDATHSNQEVPDHER